jgi:hypothetical protein
VNSLSTTEEGGFFYYLALLIGMALIGAYLWYIISVPTFNVAFQIITLFTGILLVVAAMGFVYAKTRSARISMTAVSGILGGVHGYLDLALYGLVTGIILFAWIAFGILLAFAAFNWLHE